MAKGSLFSKRIVTDGYNCVNRCTEEDSTLKVAKSALKMCKSPDISEFFSKARRLVRILLNSSTVCCAKGSNNLPPGVNVTPFRLRTNKVHPSSLSS